MARDVFGDMLRDLYTGTDISTKATVSGAATTINVIDKTAGIDDERSESGVKMPTVQPAACVRNAELTALGLEPSDLVDRTIAFNGRSWTVKAHRPRPYPGGEGPGETYLFLREVI